MKHLVCTGRQVDDRLQPYGQPCGRKFADKADRRDLVDAARAAGWSVGPDGQAMCPACRRPAAAVVDLVREVGR